MTALPLDELSALGGKFPQRTGEIICELGNKKNGGGLYRDWYKARGLGYVCIDWNGEDGAVKIDMTRPIKRQLELAPLTIHGKFPWVTNFGFTEHVGETLEEQHQCWANVDKLVAEGGRLAFCMPKMPEWKGHGKWHPTLEWYRQFAALNGYETEMLKVFDERVRPTIIGRFKKLHDVDTCLMPDSELMDDAS
jgi:hypothetical protein